MKFAIGMPVFGDYDGPVFTCADLLVHHDDYVSEILIVDNSPASPQSEPLRKWCQQHRKLRYVAFPEPVGTAPPKNAVFANAQGGTVVCLDSHVLLFPGALAALAEFYAANPDAADDLVQGPLVYNDMTTISSSLSDVWGGDGVWGQWQHDPEVETQKWFQVRAQGMGLFACSQGGWLGFNQHFRGFGGEERYIHEKFRAAGRRTWCVSGLKWWHRFGKAAPIKYPLSNRDKCRNYAIGLTELGLPLSDLKRRFVDSKMVQQAEWDAITAEAERLTGSKVKGCGCKAQRPAAPAAQTPPQQITRRGSLVSAAELFDVAVKQPSDVSEHLPTLRKMASECKTVTEFATGAATIALIAGIRDGGGFLTSYHGAYRKEAPELYRMAGGEKNFKFVTGDSLNADIEPTEMLFIDTESTAPRLLKELEKFHAKVSKFIVVHRTDTFGEFGPDGGPGLRPALRQFLKINKEWFVHKSYKNNHGLTILARDAGLKPKLPGVWRQVKNFGKAVVKDVANGMKRVPLEVVGARLDECAVCEHRNDDRCSLCGCFLDVHPTGRAGKVHYSQESCPEGRWTSVD